MATTNINLTRKIVVGTTTVESGTSGRIFFEDSSNNVNQDSGLFWNNTDQALSITGEIRHSGSNGLYHYGANGLLNTAFGFNSLVDSSLSGIDNTAFGTSTLVSNTTGRRNVAVGHFSMNSNLSGQGNVAVGRTSLTSHTSGDNNTAIGFSSLLNLTTGDNNTCVGRFSGARQGDGITNLTSLSNSVLMGMSCYPDSDGDTNSIVIGFSARGAGSNTAVIGNTSIVLTVLRGTVNMNDLPTSATGLNSGDVWNDAGTLKIV